MHGVILCCITFFCADTSLEAFNAESGIFPFSIPIGEPQSNLLNKKHLVIKVAVCVRVKRKILKNKVKWQLKDTIAATMESNSTTAEMIPT